MQNINENALNNANNKINEQIKNLKTFKQKFNIKKLFFQNQSEDKSQDPNFQKYQNYLNTLMNENLIQVFQISFELLETFNKKLLKDFQYFTCSNIDRFYQFFIKFYQRTSQEIELQLFQQQFECKIQKSKKETVDGFLIYMTNLIDIIILNLQKLQQYSHTPLVKVLYYQQKMEQLESQKVVEIEDIPKQQTEKKVSLPQEYQIYADVIEMDCQDFKNDLQNYPSIQKLKNYLKQTRMYRKYFNKNLQIKKTIDNYFKIQQKRQQEQKQQVKQQQEQKKILTVYKKQEYFQQKHKKNLEQIKYNKQLRSQNYIPMNQIQTLNSFNMEFQNENLDKKIKNLDSFCIKYQENCGNSQFVNYLIQKRKKYLLQNQSKEQKEIEKEESKNISNGSLLKKNKKYSQGDYSIDNSRNISQILLDQKYKFQEDKSQDSKRKNLPYLQQYASAKNLWDEPQKCVQKLINKELQKFNTDVFVITNTFNKR